MISDLQIERAVLDEKDGDVKMQERSLMDKEQTITVVNQLRHVIEVKAKHKKELLGVEDQISHSDKEYQLYKSFVEDAVKNETDVVLKMSEKERLKYRQLAAEKKHQNEKVASIVKQLSTFGKCARRSSYQNG